MAKADFMERMRQYEQVYEPLGGGEADGLQVRRRAPRPTPSAPTSASCPRWAARCTHVQHSLSG